MAKKTTLKEFESVFPKLEEVLLEHAKSYNLPGQALEWYKKVRTPRSLASPETIKKLTVLSYSPSKPMRSAASATAACWCATQRRCCWAGP